MRLTVLLILWLSLFVHSGACEEVSSRGVAVVPLSEAEPEEFGNLKQQSYGVFVGVDQFDDESIAPLQFAAADARAMRECFVNELGYMPLENTRLLVTGEEGEDRPSYVRIIDAIQWAADSAGPEGCVVVQISTHGMEGYVLAEDSRRRALNATAVSLSWVEQTLLKTRPNRRLLIFDACREKTSQDGQKAIGETMTSEFAAAFSKAEGFAVLKSCSQGQYSYEMEESGHGAFTHFLLQGLRGAAPPNGEGFVTVTKLGEWVKGQVESWSNPRAGGVQSPMFSILEAGGDLPLAMSQTYLDQEEKSRKEELVRKLAQMLGSGTLDREHFNLAQTALDSGDPKGEKVVSDLLEGRIAPEYLPAILERLAPEPTQAPAEAPTETPSMSPQEMYDLALHYDSGTGGFDLDDQRAAECYRDAAQRGHIEAMYNLALMYDNGEGMDEDNVAAVEWYAKAAEADYPAALNNLGIMYQNGEGVDVDAEQALEWYKKAANLGHLSGMYNLALMYDTGGVVTEDNIAAAEWYLKAAELGHPESMNNLGVMYQNGEGVQADPRKAVEWYRKAAEAGNASAMTNFGYMNEKGQGIPRSYADAVKWYRKGAENGNATGMYNLGTLYENGRGLKMDIEEAKVWYQKAADNGDQDAVAALERLQ